MKELTVYDALLISLFEYQVLSGEDFNLNKLADHIWANFRLEKLATNEAVSRKDIEESKQKD